MGAITRAAKMPTSVVKLPCDAKIGAPDPASPIMLDGVFVGLVQ